ncbi:DgyrCDS11312 [Dimorphilus gyrociliatus]|uniref:DgyrCDS11312 n=1 Tax=Dimorphilus gyrociliatus TaxID=2664684 RepID=A0A7I8W2X2_9ANNE|nr:DgyrCDS11312 [Dimorphilus gyrociliatus]
MKSSVLSPTQNRRAIQVRLLNGNNLTISTEAKSTCQDIFQEVCDHLKLHELEFFGLAQLIDDEFHFVDLNLKVQRLIKSQKTSSQNGISFVLYFRVKFYVENVALLREKITRQLYYEQLKDNLVNYSQRVTEEKCFILAAHALQADLGNSTAEMTFDPREYFPAWVVHSRGTAYIQRELPNIHGDLNGLSASRAHYRFISDASEIPTAHNLHLYAVQSKNTTDKDRKRKVDDDKVWLGVTPSGISFYEQINGWKSYVSHLNWEDITKLHCKKKKFQISVAGGKSERKFSYDAFSELRALKLLKLCEDTHKAKRMFAPRLAALKHLSENDDNRKAYREALVAPTSYVSRKSSASSATTSGIASDSARDEEKEREIMINGPPDEDRFKSPLYERGLRWTCSPTAMPWSGSPSRTNSNQSNQSAPLNYYPINSPTNAFATTLPRQNRLPPNQVQNENNNFVIGNTYQPTPVRQNMNPAQRTLFPPDKDLVVYKQSPHRLDLKTTGPIDKQTVLQRLQHVQYERQQMNQALKECNEAEQELANRLPTPQHTSHVHSYFNEPSSLQPAKMSVQRSKPTEFMTASSKPLTTPNRPPARNITDPGLTNLSQEDMQKFLTDRVASAPHTPSSQHKQSKPVANGGRPRARSMTSTSHSLCPLHSAVSSEIVDAASRGQEAPIIAALSTQCLCIDKKKSNDIELLSTTVNNLHQVGKRTIIGSDSSA